jgi:hypothetical protein
VHAVRVRDERDVDAIVDHDPRTGRDGFAHEREQRPALEILLADLNDVGADSRQRAGRHHAPIGDRDEHYSINCAVGDDAFA